MGKEILFLFTMVFVFSGYGGLSWEYSKFISEHTEFELYEGH